MERPPMPLDPLYGDLNVTTPFSTARPSSQTHPGHILVSHPSGTCHFPIFLPEGPPAFLCSPHLLLLFPPGSLSGRQHTVTERDVAGRRGDWRRVQPPAPPPQLLSLLVHSCPVPPRRGPSLVPCSGQYLWGFLSRILTFSLHPPLQKLTVWPALHSSLRPPGGSVSRNC